MLTFTLILFFHVGSLGSTDSNSAISIPNFTNEAECIAAGEKTNKLVKGTTKEVNYVCVKQTGVKQ